MKTKMISILLGILLCATSLYAQETPFSSFQKHPYLKTTFITKPMFDLVPDLKVGNTTIKEMKNKLEQVEIYNNESKGSTGHLGNVMKKNTVSIIERDYDLILSLQEGDTEIMFYTRKGVQRSVDEARAEANDNLITDLVMINYDSKKNSNYGGDCTVIRIVGKLTAEDIRKFANVKK
ncbi:hypothetical protein M2480_000315 [Parabacteroides sp. PFB2-12]|uniref:DUF4252 domain-containing protein n=1 Tax=unclassified Parabacteroides TaxID=2649774 RepID=UPI0024757937|nr:MULTISPECIES: DUF4252 domain-containing protein [unclassified Parabacteroides]MDH6341165.1 hypothetical protein [Parabacteroides sp. PM6-13]MDH6389355.1 hypothetical protein [Parabacteroides sp. PFB2-12]MDL2309615.1 DUF4252 domain-containing protein [Parabacteroides sp. OttesenSCG-928-B22]